MGFSDDLPGAIRQLVHDTTPEGTSGDLRHYIADSMAGTRADAALPLFESLLRWNPLAVWPHEQCPVVAINGDLIHPADRERQAGIIAEHPVPGTGHFLQMENPAAFNAAMEDVLTRVGQDGHPTKKGAAGSLFFSGVRRLAFFQTARRSG